MMLRKLAWASTSLSRGGFQPATVKSLLRTAGAATVAVGAAVVCVVVGSTIGSAAIGSAVIGSAVGAAAAALTDAAAGCAGGSAATLAGAGAGAAVLSARAGGAALAGALCVTWAIQAPLLLAVPWACSWPFWSRLCQLRLSACGHWLASNPPSFGSRRSRVF